MSEPTTLPGADTAVCWNCESAEIEHRWLSDPVKLRNLDEWKCNECGFRWARWSGPGEDVASSVRPW